MSLSEEVGETKKDGKATYKLLLTLVLWGFVGEH